MDSAETKTTPTHQWTHDGDRVLLVKCVNRDGSSYGGFLWPEFGPVEIPGQPDRTPGCHAGMVYGWPWGIGVGECKAADARARWLVFAADPANVIDCDGKAGVVRGDNGEGPEVVYCGDMAGAMYYTSDGRIAWVEHASEGSASSSGDRSSASSSGDRSSASSSGDSSGASSSGDRSSASSSGDRSSASRNGECGIIDISPTSIGCVQASEFAWAVRLGAVLLVRWGEKHEQYACLDSKALGLADGEEVLVVEGSVQTSKSGGK